MAEAHNHPAVAAMLRDDAAPAAQELPDAMDVVGLEYKLGMGLDELVMLDRRGASGQPLMQKLRETHAALTSTDKLCMSLDDIIAQQTKAGTAVKSREAASPRGRGQGPGQRQRCIPRWAAP